MANVDDLLYAPIPKETADEFTDILNDVAAQQNANALNHQLNQQMNQILQGQQAHAQNNPFYQQSIYNQGGLANQGGLGNLGNGGLGSGPLPTSSQPLNKVYWEASGDAFNWEALPPSVKQARYFEIAKAEYERLPRCLRPGISFETAMAKIEAMITGPYNRIE